MKYNLKELYPNVFHVTVKDSYDLCMLFCRAQEFYESPFKEIRGKHFALLKFMEIYSKRIGNGCFTYCSDWGGFNVPGKVIYDLFSQEIIDFNLYDKTLYEIHKAIDKKDYYLIGSQPKDESTIEHEAAHAFFYLHKKYKKVALKVVNDIPKKAFAKIEKHLKDIGYSNKTLKDEVHAYVLSDLNDLTNDIKFTKKEEDKLEKARVILRENFKQQLPCPPNK